MSLDHFLYVVMISVILTVFPAHLYYLITRFYMLTVGTGFMAVEHGWSEYKCNIYIDGILLNESNTFELIGCIKYHDCSADELKDWRLRNYDLLMEFTDSRYGITIDEHLLKLKKKRLINTLISCSLIALSILPMLKLGII